MESFRPSPKIGAAAAAAAAAAASAGKAVAATSDPSKVFDRHKGVAAKMEIQNIDTDMIIPKQVWGAGWGYRGTGGCYSIQSTPPASGGRQTFPPPSRCSASLSVGRRRGCSTVPPPQIYISHHYFPSSFSSHGSS